MAGTITHSWDGTVLTVTSDSGSSSMDLKGSAGPIGPRGPQGAPGVSVGGSGGVTVDLSNYYTKDETDNAIQTAINDIDPGADIDLSNYYTKQEINNKGYATETFVTNKIAEAQLSGGDSGSVDLSGYATKDDIADMATETYVDDAFKFDWLGSLAGKTISEFRAMLDEWLAVNVDKTAKCQFSAGNNFINLWNAEDTTSTITEGSRWTCEITSGYLNNGYTVITLSNYYYNKIYTINKNVTWKPIQEIATINVVSSMIADAIAALDGSEVEY